MDNPVLTKTRSQTALLLLLAASLLMTGCRRKPKAPPQETSGPPNAVSTEAPSAMAARVNGQGLHYDEVMPLVEARMTPLRQGATDLSPAFLQQREKEITREVVETLVIKSLLKAEIQAQGIVVSDEEVARRLEEIASEQVPSLSSQALLEQVKQTQGQDAQTYQAQIREDLALRKLFESLYQDQASVNDDDIRHYYETHREEFSTPAQVQARHIQFPREDKIRAQSVLAQLHAGADFGELVRANSADEKTVSLDGDLGFFQRGDMEAAFDEAAFALKPGGLSDIVTTTVGLHIIKVTDVRPPTEKTLEEAEAEIRAKLMAEKQLAMRRAYIKKLKSQASIDYYLGH